MKEKQLAEMTLEELNDLCRRLQEELTKALWFMRMKTFTKIDDKKDNSSD